MGNSAEAGRFPRPRSTVLLRVATDERLVALVRGGSERAFEAIYDRHHRGILAFSRHMLGSADEAEDAVQHTFMAAYRHLLGGDAAIQLRPWLYTIARNRCLSMLRTRREDPLDHHQLPATDHLAAEVQRRQDVRELLADVAALPDDQRAALVLAELGAVSHDEIAIVLEVPRQRVKALVFQARTSLAASRTARETPCAEIREQLANLRGGALRRTTLYRHLRECPGCQAFREEVVLQRKTLALALPVIPTLGLKEAALGAAFGSAGGGGGAAAAGGGALAAKALVAVALVGGGTTAGVEVARHTPPPKVADAAPAAAGAVRGETAAVPVAATLPAAGRQTAASVAAGHAGRGHAKARHGARGRARKAKDLPRGQAKAKHVPHGHARKAKDLPRGQAKAKNVPPGQAKRAKDVPPGQAKAKREPHGQAKKAITVTPGKAEIKAAKPVKPAKAEAAEPAAPPVAKAHGKQR